MNYYSALADFVKEEHEDKKYNDDYDISKTTCESFVVKAENVERANEIAFDEFLKFIEKENLKVNHKSIYIWEITEDDLLKI